ncbi:MAG: hypothetical protein ABF868_07595 [Sporolactobacillus sp.]
MSALLMAVLLWVAGLAAISGGFFLIARMRKLSDLFLHHAERNKGKDNVASMEMTIQGKVLGHIPGCVVHVLLSTAGLLLIAFGCVALGFFFG